MPAQLRNGIVPNSSPPAGVPRHGINEFVLRQLSLPCQELSNLWERLVLNERRASREDVLRSLHVQYHVAAEGGRNGYALHGTTLFYGPPGTGKTSLAICSPNALLHQLGKQGLLLEINTHSLPGSERGACQRNICRLADGIKETAATVSSLWIVLNELETLASSRQSISLATNPLDTAFAVNALIESLDSVAAKCPNVFFLATTNLPDQVDAAIFDRFDDVFHVPLPDSAERLNILAQAVESLQPERSLPKHLRRAAALIQASSDNHDSLQPTDKKLLGVCEPLVKATKGMSPRRLTQLPIRCLSLRTQELHSPITLQQLIAAARRIRRAR